MPTYEFKCPTGHVFDKFYPTITAKRRIKCPQCGKPAVRMISAGAGLVFKGSGFYITDYKRAAEPKKSSEGEAKPAETPKKPKKDSSSTDK